MFKMILAAVVAMGLGSVAFANETAKPAETAPAATETKEAAPAADKKMAKKEKHTKKMEKKEHAEGAAH